MSRSISDMLRNRRFVYQVSLQCIEMSTLLRRPESIEISPTAIVDMFCFGGCDFVPGTTGIGHTCALY